MLNHVRTRNLKHVLTNNCGFGEPLRAFHLFDIESILGSFKTLFISFSKKKQNSVIRMINFKLLDLKNLNYMRKNFYIIEKSLTPTNSFFGYIIIGAVFKLT